MNKLNLLEIMLMVAICALIVILIITNVFKDKRIEELWESTNALIQESGTNFHEVNTAPDSVYFVTFNKDTIWYIRNK